MSLLPRSLVGGLLAAAFPAAVFAEDAPVKLDPIEVTAPIADSLTSPTVDADRAALALTPGSTEVVDSDRYLTGRAATLADTFALSPGVFAQPRFGSDEARLSIRGSGLQRTFHGRGIRVLQDGVPINLADGGFDMQSLEPVAADHINIWRGANALATGASTLGGAIDYVSRNGRTSPGVLTRVEGGSFGTLRGTLAAGGASGDLDGYASFTHSQLDGFRDHAAQENQRLFANTGLRLSDNVETRLYLAAIRTDSELPGNLTKAELEADPSQADNSFFGAARYNNKRDYDLVRLASKTTVEVGADTRADFLAGFTVKDLDHPITPFAGVIDQYSKDTLLGVTVDHDGELLDRANRLRAGVLFSHGRTDAATYANVFGSRGALTADADQTATNLELFAEDQLALGRGFTAVAGVNAAFNRRENGQRVGAAASYDRDYEGFSPKLGLRWDDADRDIRFYANVSGSHEPPSFSETNAGTVANDAQTAVTVELGSRGQRGPVRWDASVYHAKIKDEFLALNDALGTPLGTTNADRTIHEGVELGLEADLLGNAWNATEVPADRLVLRTAWTYGRFKFDDDAVYGDNTLAGLPPHLVRGELLWETKSGYYFGPTFEWVPVKSYVDHANTLSAGPYALLGWKLGRSIDAGLSWFVEAKNLTDETYAATTNVIADALGADARAFLPGDGRSFFAGLEYRF